MTGQKGKYKSRKHMHSPSESWETTYWNENDGYSFSKVWSHEKTNKHSSKKLLDQMKDSPIERVMEDRQEQKIILK